MLEVFVGNKAKRNTKYGMKLFYGEQNQKKSIDLNIHNKK